MSVELIRYSAEAFDLVVTHSEYAVSLRRRGDGWTLVRASGRRRRALDGDFDAADGIELISRFSARGAGRMMLISNYSDAQADAIKAGALPGFGKSELSTAKPRQLLASALAESKLEK